MRPIIFLILLVIWLIWVEQDRSSVILTPRHLYEDTFSVCWPWKVRLVAATELLLSLDIIIYLYLLPSSVKIVPVNSCKDGVYITLQHIVVFRAANFPLQQHIIRIQVDETSIVQLYICNIIYIYTSKTIGGPAPIPVLHLTKLELMETPYH